MFENPACRLCKLSNWAASVCLQGLGNPDTARLVILVGEPTYQDDLQRRSFVSDGAAILKNLFLRMSVDIETDVYFDYCVKCYGGKHMPKQKAERLACYEACSTYRFATLQNMPNVGAVVAMGKLAVEATIGVSELKHFEGESWTPSELDMRRHVPHVWVTYSPAYLLEKPAEIPNVYRVLFTAAAEAGLNPKPNLTAPHYVWDRD